MWWVYQWPFLCKKSHEWIKTDSDSTRNQCNNGVTVGKCDGIWVVLLRKDFVKHHIKIRKKSHTLFPGSFLKTQNRLTYHTTGRHLWTTLFLPGWFLYRHLWLALQLDVSWFDKVCMTSGNMSHHTSKVYDPAMGGVFLNEGGVCGVGSAPWLVDFQHEVSQRLVGENNFDMIWQHHGIWPWKKLTKVTTSPPTNRENNFQKLTVD